MKPTDMLVTEKGGRLRAFAADGEVLFIVPVPAGVTPAREYVALLPDGAEYDFDVKGGDVVVVPMRGRVYGRVRATSRYESGANPDYVPASIADQMQRQLLRRLHDMSDAVDRLQRRERAAASAAIPRGPDPASDVVEAGPAAE